MSEPTPPPEQEGHALLRDLDQTRTYPCRNCGGSLRFDVSLQKLACPSCGGVQDLVAVDEQVVENDLVAALNALHADRAHTLTNGIGPGPGTDKEVTCRNCGGRVAFTDSLTATKCPFCATPIQRDDIHDAPARLSVDGVLPFRVDEKTAQANIDDWVKSRRFAPREFKRYSQKGALNGVYAAYFTYDAQTTTDYQGQRGTVHTSGSGKNRRTYTVWRNVAGQVNNTFDDVAVFANDGFDRAKVVDLEPWPTGEAKPYSGEYLAGFLSRTYDHDVEQCRTEATARMEAGIRQAVCADIGGDKQRITYLSTTWRGMTYKHLLLPIWLLTVIFASQPFQVMINGLTGEVQGDRPYSKVKMAFTMVALVLATIGGFFIPQAQFVGFILLVATLWVGSRFWKMLKQ